MFCITLYVLYKFGLKSNLVYKKEKGLIIGIGGDSASGKSTLLRDIKSMLGRRLTCLEGDADHKWERENENWEKFTHLNPKANLLHGQLDQLMSLKIGKSIYRRDYDHDKGHFNKPQKINAGEFTIISGLHPFYLPLARKIIDLKIFLDTEEKLRCHWKIQRDVRERGYSQEDVQKQIEKRMTDANQYIHPQKEFADLIISYYVEGDLGTADPKLSLKVIMDSSINLESMLRILHEEEIEFYWDYADDLKNQFVVLQAQPSREIIEKVAKEIIPNIEEIITSDAVWLDGQRGFLQMIIIIMLSEKMTKQGGYVEN
jgi:uridine kinase